MTVPSIDVQIEEIMYRFDWAKVHRTMTLLDWQWAASGTGVPTVGEIMVGAHKLMEAAVAGYKAEEQWTYAKSGGFAVRIYKSTDGPLIELAFEVADWIWEG